MRPYKRFYAYIPDKNGYEPTGSTGNRITFKLKTRMGAIKRCKRIFNSDFFIMFSLTGTGINEVQKCEYHFI